MLLITCIVGSPNVLLSKLQNEFRNLTDFKKKLLEYKYGKEKIFYTTETRGIQFGLYNMASRSLTEVDTLYSHLFKGFIFYLIINYKKILELYLERF